MKTSLLAIYHIWSVNVEHRSGQFSSRGYNKITSTCESHGSCCIGLHTAVRYSSAVSDVVRTYSAAAACCFPSKPLADLPDRSSLNRFARIVLINSVART